MSATLSQTTATIDDIPVSLTTAGRVTLTTDQISANIIAQATTLNSGYTILPAGLIEDLSSTITAAVYICDSYVTELINSISPYTANLYLLNQLASIYGVIIGADVNVSAYVLFTGTPGYPISPGFTVSDGTYLYVVPPMEGGIISASGTSSLIYVVAVQTGTWPIPANTVNTIVTSVPTAISLSVTNPQAGNQATGTPTESSIRNQVLQQGLASAQGMLRYLKAQLYNIAGVNQRLVSAIQVSATAWEIIVGGGDPYQIANAIFNSVFCFNQLVGTQVVGQATARNVTVSIYDYPDTYSIVFVNPPQQSVAIAMIWNTTATNTVSPTGVQQSGIAALVAYINSIPVAQPINVFELQNAFQEAVAAILPINLITRMIFTVSINGSVVAPNTGTGLIYGDPEGYFQTSSSAVTVTQG